MAGRLLAAPHIGECVIGADQIIRRDVTSRTKLWGRKASIRAPVPGVHPHVHNEFFELVKSTRSRRSP